MNGLLKNVMNDRLGYIQQNITKEDIKEVVNTLNSDFITQGPVVEKFENSLAEKVNSKYGVSFNSATSALHLACLSLDLNKNDYLWTSPNTFVSSANCGKMCGAKVDFVDIDGENGNLCINKLETKLIKAHKENKLPKVLVSVHFAGQPTKQEVIWNLAQEYDFKIIEDASHSLGSKRKSTITGSCQYSDITVFSFHPVKIITTGEGGMALTNNQSIAEKLRILRNNGITRDKDKYINKVNNNKWYYEQHELGFNYRLSEIQAALGYSQLNRLDSVVKKRNNISEIYDRELENLPIKSLKVSKNNYSSRHFYTIRVNNKDRDNLFDALRSKNINANVHYIPVHTHPYYKKLGFKEGDFPEAEAHGKEAITIPIYPDLNIEEQYYIINSIKKYYNEYR
jgi:UDP-4-amino-4,6-dideoxy-N-acetyl-beta-L-altrosamine transaminase